MNPSIQVGRTTTLHAHKLIFHHCDVPHEVSDMDWVSVGHLTDYLNAIPGNKRRYTTRDIFGEFNLLYGQHNGHSRMLWVSCLERGFFCEGTIPTDWRAEIYIPEKWANTIKTIVACRTLANSENSLIQEVA